MWKVSGFCVQMSQWAEATRTTGFWGLGSGVRHCRPLWGAREDRIRPGWGCGTFISRLFPALSNTLELFDPEASPPIPPPD